MSGKCGDDSIGFAMVVCTLIVFTYGDPDLLDAIIHYLMSQ